MNAVRRGSKYWVPVISNNTNYLVRSFNSRATTNLHSNYLNKTIKSRKTEELVNRLENEFGEFNPIVYSEGDVNCPGHEVIEQS